MVKTAKSPELQTQGNHYQIPADFFVETDELILKFTQNCEGPIIAKKNLEKENKVGFTFPFLKTYHNATVIKSVWYTTDIKLNGIGLKVLTEIKLCV